MRLPLSYSKAQEALEVVHNLMHIKYSIPSKYEIIYFSLCTPTYTCTLPTISYKVYEYKKKWGKKTSKEKLEIKILEPVPISYEPILE